MDHFKKGNKSDGYFTIYLYETNNPITVYCDTTSEPGSVWTLVMSYIFENKDMEQFGSNGAMQNDGPVNEHLPNWNFYRMSLAQMRHVKSQSTHWRVTCSFPTHKVDYTDYVRGNFTDFDIMTLKGYGECKKVEYVNVRGHRCAHCTLRWRQYGRAAHLDGSTAGCQFQPTKDALSHEDNFGLYSVYNGDFRCSSGPLYTTNWWFGGYL